jgi:hypothetical protein
MFDITIKINLISTRALNNKDEIDFATVLFDALEDVDFFTELDFSSDYNQMQLNLNMHLEGDGIEDALARSLEAVQGSLSRASQKANWVSAEIGEVEAKLLEVA